MMKNALHKSFFLVMTLCIIHCHTDQDLVYKRSTFRTRPLEVDSAYDYSPYIPYPVKEELPLYPCKCLEETTYYHDRRRCSVKALFNAIQNRVVYPSSAERDRLEGRVFLSFVVAADGELKDFKILRDIGGGCGKEAIRVLKTLPQYWIPGRRNDEEVDMDFRLSVRFALE